MELINWQEVAPHVRVCWCILYNCITHRQRQRQRPLPLKRSRMQGTPTMYKSNLQAMCQQRGWELPAYQVTKQGQDHSPLFSATVTVNATSFSSTSPSSSSKKAQSEAAKLAYDHFSLISPSPPSLSGNWIRNFVSFNVMKFTS